MALVQGIDETKETLRRWHARPWPVLRVWLAWSLVIAAGLLGAVYVVARLSPPDPTLFSLPGVTRDATLADAGFVLFRNSLVLALHGMACVAGFMAGYSMPQIAAGRSGLDRWVHEKAGPFAIAFVMGATLFSLSTQAYAIGSSTSSVAAQLDTSPAVLLVSLLPHAVPELVALFLPLAAWTIASRRGDWNQLLAATAVTVSLAVPVLIASAAVEVYLSPRLLLALTTG